MRDQVFRCDQCKKVIGARPHISLSFGSASGVAMPPNPLFPHSWDVKQSVSGKFAHFCTVDHLAKYFDGLFAKATKTEKPSVSGAKRPPRTFRPE